MTTDVAVTSLAQSEYTAYTNDQLRGTTSKFSLIFPSAWAGDSVIKPFLISMAVFAFIANLAMLVNLIVYRQANKKTMNIFIFNQSVLDLVAAFFVAVKMALMMSGYLKTKTGVLRIF